MWRQYLGASLLLALGVAGIASCSRTATEPVPDWLFTTYSDRETGTYEDVTVTRYTFYEDNRVTAETVSNCGATLIEYELTWEERDDGELALHPADGSPTIPGSGTISHWIVTYGAECEPLQLEGVLKADGRRMALGEMYEGAVCVEAVPPPDDWGGGEWNECEAAYCDGSGSVCE